MTKTYGDLLAAHHVGFLVRGGQVFGFWDPRGWQDDHAADADRATRAYRGTHPDGHDFESQVLFLDEPKPGLDAQSARSAPNLHLGFIKSSHEPAIVMIVHDKSKEPRRYDMLKGKTRYVVLGAVGALVLLLGGVGIAYAQGTSLPLGDQRLFGGGRRFAGQEGRALGGELVGRDFHQPSPTGPGPVQGLVRITAEMTGLGEDQVVAALEDGRTVAEIAEAQDVDPQEIVDAALAEAASRLQEAVEHGRLTEERMDQMLERLAEELPQRLDQPWQPGGPRGMLLDQFGEGFWSIYDAVAEALGMTPENLFVKLHDGQSVAEIAEEQGVEMEEIRDAVEDARVEMRKQAIEQAVENGRLSQEQADWLLEGLEQGFVPRGQDFGPGRGVRPGHGGRGGRSMGW